ncbi:RNA 2',3'-cyclic phosphodiesterase [bacterium]|nr:RNA 2',3'-cyclic phosphodiesterase [bacterium]
MVKRIFIAINLPDDIKNQLSLKQSKLDKLFSKSDIPVRWTKKENLHLTLYFLGYIRENKLESVFELTKKTSSSFESFSIKLNKIVYAPLNSFPPRMIWATGEKSSHFIELKRKIEDGLVKENFFSKSFFKKEKKKDIIHITLARIRSIFSYNPENLPDISEDIDLDFKVNSIEVMESHLKPKGPEYTILKSFNLKVS